MAERKKYLVIDNETNEELDVVFAENEDEAVRNALSALDIGVYIIDDEEKSV